MGQECPLNGLLPTDDPRVKGVFHKLQGLLLNIRKARLFQIADHVGRDPENSSNFIDLEFACFQELRLLRRDTDGRVFHAFFQNGDFIGVTAAAEGGLPALPYTLRVFDGAGVFQHTTGRRTVSKELGSVFLTGNRHADGVLCHSDGAVTHQTVKAQTGNVQHIRWEQRHGELLVLNGFIRTTVIGVVQPTTLVPVHRHLVRHQRIEGNDLVLPIADDLRVSVAPEEQVRHERFPEHKGTHFRVRLIVEQVIERMVKRHCLAAAVCVFVEVQRQPSDSLRQDTDAGIHGGHLHGRPFCHCFAGGRAAHEKGVVAACRSVLGLVSGFEQP